MTRDPYGLAVDAFRALAHLRVHLCPIPTRELLRSSMVAEVNLAIDEESIAGLDPDVGEADE